MPCREWPKLVLSGITVVFGKTACEDIFARMPFWRRGGRRSEADIFGAPFWQAILVGQGAGRGRDAKSIQVSHSLRVFSS